MALITGAIQRVISTVRTARTAAASFAGAIPSRLLNTTRTARTAAASFAGAISSSLSAVQRFYARSVSGLVTFAGRAWRRVPLSGWLIRTLNLSRTKGGTLQAAGEVITGAGQIFSRTVVGAAFLIGSALTDLAHTVTKASSVAIGGTISGLKNMLRRSAGTVAPSATIQRALTISQESPIYNSLYFDIADDGCLYHAESGLNTYPVTVAAWFRLTSLPVYGSVEMIVAGANIAGSANLDRFAIRLVQSGPGSGYQYGTIADPSSVGSDYAYILSPLVVGTWYHAAAVFTSATSRQIYLDGVAGTANTQSQVVSTIDSVSIGGLFYEGVIEQNPTDGMIQEVGFWDIALTPANIASLAAGALPKDVELANLISYNRMKDWTVPDEISGVPWTLLGYPDQVPYTSAEEDYTGAFGLDMAGSLNKALAKTYDSALSFAGAVSRSAINSIYTAAGAVSSAGSYLRGLSMGRSPSGALSFAKDLAYKSSGVVYPSIIAAAVSFSSTLLAGIGVDASAAGTLAVYGRITIIDAIITRLTDASITPAGALSYVLVGARSVLSGAISPIATLSRLLSMARSVSAAISLAGSIAYDIATDRFYSTISNISFSATISKAVAVLRTYSGAISPSGILTRLYNLARTQDSLISFAGTVLAALVGADTRQGILSFAGVVDRGTITGSKTEQSAVGFGGAVTGHRVYARALSGDLTFSKSFIKIRETLYLGPPNYGT